MEIEDYIERIIEKGDIRDMNTLSDILEEVMKVLKDYDKECYQKYEMELYEMAYGKKLNDKAKIKWVEDMRPYSKWTIQEVEKICSNYEVRIPLYSFFVIINMLYSDMSKVLGTGDSEESLLRYIKASEDWYYDEDANNTEEAKLYCYWKYIVN